MFVLSCLTTAAQEPTPTPACPPRGLQVPVIAPEFHPAEKPLPELGRIGVDMDRQRPLRFGRPWRWLSKTTKIFEVARQNVKNCRV